MEKSRKLPQNSYKPELPCDLAIPLLGIDLKEIKSVFQELSVLHLSMQAGCAMQANV